MYTLSQIENETKQKYVCKSVSKELILFVTECYFIMSPYGVFILILNFFSCPYYPFNYPYIINEKMVMLQNIQSQNLRKYLQNYSEANSLFLTIIECQIKEIVMKFVKIQSII